MKYIIDLPEEFAEATIEYWEKTVGMSLEPYTELDRKIIEDEVWELTKNIYGMSIEDKMSCFGFSLTSAITSNLSCQEAKAKFKAWKKQKDDIHVGDEYCDTGEVFVVTNVDNSDIVSVIFTDGSVDELFKKELRECKKTGRHFDEVEELLRKIKGGIK